MNKNSNKKRFQNLKGKMIEILIRDGKKNKEIARLCNISLRTVERYRKKIMDSDKEKEARHSEAEEGKEQEKDNFLEEAGEYGLTDKQRLFCYYYMQSFNIYQSSLKAGYSESFALSQSYKLLENVGIKAFLNKLKEEQKTEFLLSQERLLNRHTQIAFSNVNDIVNLDGTLKEGADGTLIKKITVKTSKSEDDSGYKESSSVSVEMEDRKESLKFLTKYLEIEPEIIIAKQKLEIEKEKLEIMKKQKVRKINTPPAYFDDMDEELDGEDLDSDY